MGERCFFCCGWFGSGYGLKWRATSTTPIYRKMPFLTVQFYPGIPPNIEKCRFWPYKSTAEYPQILKIPVFGRNRDQNTTPIHAEISFMAEVGLKFYGHQEENCVLGCSWINCRPNILVWHPSNTIPKLKKKAKVLFVTVITCFPLLLTFSRPPCYYINTKQHSCPAFRG